MNHNEYRRLLDEPITKNAIVANEIQKKQDITSFALDMAEKGTEIANLVDKNYHLSSPVKFGYEVQDLLAENVSDKKIEKVVNTIVQSARLSTKHQSLSHCKMNFNLSNGNQQGTNIGNYTTQIIPMLVTEVGSEITQNNYILRRMFPQMSTTAMEFMFDKAEGMSGRVPLSGYNQPLPQRQKINFSNFKFEGIRASEEVIYRGTDLIYTREKGTGLNPSSSAGLAQSLALETAYGMNRLDVTVNLTLSDAILRGGFNYDGDIISTGILNSNTFTFSQSLGTYSPTTGIATPNNSPNFDPLLEISSYYNNFPPLRKYRHYAIDMVVHPVVYNLIMKNANTKSWLLQRFITSSDVKARDEIMNFFYVPGLPNFRLVSADTTWQPKRSDPINNIYADSRFIMEGVNETLTNQSFFGYTALNLSPFGGGEGFGSLVIGSDILQGSYINNTTGYGVRIFDMTNITPQDPHIKLIPFITFMPSVYRPEAVFLVDPQITLVA